MFNMLKFEMVHGIAIVTINRPEALNALNKELIEELEKVIEKIEKDDSINVLIFTGNGRAFVAGADIAEQSILDVEGGRAWGKRGAALFRRIEKLEKPTIAAVNGFALGGGCELAMCFDMIIASTKAVFGQPEVSLGIIPGFSGTQRLPRRVGLSKAMELIYTGEYIKSDEALKIGLVNKVTEPEKLMDAAKELAFKIMKNSLIAVKYAGVAIKKGYESDIETGISIENELFALCFSTNDQKEGMNAFLEKRDARFINK